MVGKVSVRILGYKKLKVKLCKQCLLFFVHQRRFNAGYRFWGVRFIPQGEKIRFRKLFLKFHKKDMPGWANCYMIKRERACITVYMYTVYKISDSVIKLCLHPRPFPILYRTRCTSTGATWAPSGSPPAPAST